MKKQIILLLTVLLCLFVLVSCKSNDQTVDGASTNFLYEINKDGTVTITGLEIPLKEIDIPAYISIENERFPVTSIDEYAFYDYSSLTSVTIPDSVKSIGIAAFQRTGYYNDENNWKDGVLYIGHHLIDADPSLSGSYSIKKKTVCIAEWAFANCSSLTAITIPDSVTSIGEGTFDSCSKLTSVVIPDDITCFGKQAFHGCSNLISVSIPNGVTCIDTSAFSGCSSLTSVTIPDSVSTIGNFAFNKCTNLTYVSFEDPEGWGYSANDLANPSTAARYLTYDYTSKFWYHK